MKKPTGNENLLATPDLPKGLQWLLMGILFIYLSLFFLYEQYHVPGFDYGKLVKYGEAIIENGEIFTTNYFSYAFPDYEFVNHHWGTGLIFYGLHQLGGFNMLTLLALVLYMGAFLIVFFMARKISNTSAMLFAALLILPLVGSRNQPRPEAFSMLFFALTLFLLIGFLKHPEKYKRLIWALPVIQLLWVNLHILFFIGFFLQGTLLLQLLINKENRRQILTFALVFIVSVLACLINANGLEGLLYPMNIMKEITYPVSENRSYQEMITGLPRGGQIQYEILFGLSLLGVVLWFRNRKMIKSNIYLLIWLVAFGLLTLWRVRAVAMFSYVFMIFFATTFQMVISGKSPKYKRGVNNFVLGLFIVTIILLINLRAYWYNPYYGDRKFGVGIKEEMAEAAEFYREFDIQGPVFNNFDVGDYMIYYLFPETKVLIDARPEAYPPEFINDQFLPALFNEKKWLELDYQYGFNAVFLAKHQQISGFVGRMLRDSEWFVVYNDKYNIIFIRMNGPNRSIVRNDLIRNRNSRIMMEMMKEMDLMPEKY